MNTKAFTLMEMLTVIAIIATISIVAIVLLNPQSQIQRAQDTKQKTDLLSLKKVFEDWYNDKNCYPMPSEVCFDPVVGSLTCHICGREAASPSMSSYLSELPCSLKHPATDFTYEVDVSSCPQKYKIYTNLARKNDEDSVRLGCENGACGPRPYFGFDFGVSSPNVDLGASDKYIFDGIRCNDCGGIQYSDCGEGVPRDKIYTTINLCCDTNIGACNRYYCKSNKTGTCPIGACIECGWSSSYCFDGNECCPDSIRKENPTCVP